MKTETTTSQLTSYPVVVEIPVQWSEMDAYGHVHNSVFFRYFETARVEYLARCGFLDLYDLEQVGVILHSTECRFRRPLYHPDTVLVGARTTDLADDRFTMQYLAVSAASNEAVAEGSAVVVVFDYASHKKTPLPGNIREQIYYLEQRPGELH